MGTQELRNKDSGLFGVLVPYKLKEPFRSVRFLKNGSLTISAPFKNLFGECVYKKSTRFQLVLFVYIVGQVQ